MILLFDLDGTLTDPRAGIVGSARYAFERLGLEPPPDGVLATFIGPPLRSMFASLLAETAPGRVEEAVLAYRERYRDLGIYQTRRYGGVAEMLEGTRALAVRVLLATSKPWIFAARVLAHLGIDRHFDAVYGPELDGTRDDKASLVAHLLEREGIAGREAVMVGDRAADVHAATANEVEPVGVLWGYGSEGELRAAGARWLARTPGDLTLELRRIASSRAR
jgi:phosphoglycolate phosphatase